MIAILLISSSGCDKSKSNSKNALGNSISMVMSEMDLTEDEAFAVLEILCDLGLDAEIEYIYADEADGETFYKVWYGLHLMKVYLKDGRVERVFKNQKLIYPSAPIGSQGSADSSSDPSHPANGELNATVISITSPIKSGSSATLEIQGEPNTKYEITVRYASGASTASGLDPKTSDSNGKVSWTWKVGSQVKAGIYTATVTSGGNSLTIEFEVE